MVLEVILFVLLVLGALAFIAAPLVRGQRLARREEERLQAIGEKQRAIQLIKDLDLDRETGKVEEADWQEQRAALEAAAIEAMRKLDTMGGDEGDDPVERAIREEREKLHRRGA